MKHVSAWRKLGIHIHLVTDRTLCSGRNLHRIVIGRARKVSLIGLRRRLSWILMTLTGSLLIRRSLDWSRCWRWSIRILQERLRRLRLLLTIEQFLRKGSLDLCWECKISQFLRTAAHRNESSCCHGVIVGTLQRIAAVCSRSFASGKGIGRKI